MKTKIKRHSRSVISVLLAVCMLISCMTAAMIATDAAKTEGETVGANADSEMVGYTGGRVKGDWDSWTLHDATGDGFTVNLAADRTYKFVFIAGDNNDQFSSSTTISGTTNYNFSRNDTDAIKLKTTIAGNYTFQVTGYDGGGTSMSTRITYPVDNTPTTWTVVGSATNSSTGGQSDVLFGSTWDPTLTANDLTESGGTWTWSKNNVQLSAGTIAYKVAKNHAWDTTVPSGNNATQPVSAGTYNVTITYDGTNVSMTLTQITKSTLTVASVGNAVVKATYNGTTANEGGTISNIPEGAEVSISVTPDSGYKCSGITSSGGGAVTGELYSFTLTMPGANTTVTANITTVTLKRVYFSNNVTGYGQVYAYVHKLNGTTVTDEYLGKYPGTTMTKGENSNIWYIEVPDDETYIAFVSGEGYTTGELEIPWSTHHDKPKYYPGMDRTKPSVGGDWQEYIPRTNEYTVSDGDTMGSTGLFTGITATMYDYYVDDEVTGGWLTGIASHATNYNNEGYTYNDPYYAKLNTALAKYANDSDMPTYGIDYPLYFGNLNYNGNSDEENKYYNWNGKANNSNYFTDNKTAATGLSGTTLAGSTIHHYKSGVANENGAPMAMFDEDFLSGENAVKATLATILRTSSFPVRQETMRTLYLNPSTNWKTNNAWFAVVFRKTSNDSSVEHWVKMTYNSSLGYYTAQIPSDCESYAKVIFARMNPASSNFAWSNKWNDTGELNMPAANSNNVLCTTTDANDWNSGSFSAYSGTKTHAYYEYDSTGGKDNAFITNIDTTSKTANIDYYAGSGYAVKQPEGSHTMGFYPFDYNNVISNGGKKASRVYLKPNDDWKSDGAGFKAVFRPTSGNTSNEAWSSMTYDDTLGLYYADVPAGREGNKLIFARMNNSTNTGWNNKWNDTGELNIPTTDAVVCEITGWSNSSEWKSNPNITVTYNYINGYADTTNKYAHDHGFGMKLNIQFTLNQNGLNEDGTPQVFDFSGDDDLWVFVDGKLVLDLGGAHAKTTGSINFNTKTVTANTTEAIPSGVTRNGSFTYNENPNYVHTMTIYYMERGMFESNLKFGFSFHAIPNMFWIDKKIRTKEIINAGFYADNGQAGTASNKNAAMTASEGRFISNFEKSYQDEGFTVTQTVKGGNPESGYSTSDYETLNVGTRYTVDNDEVAHYTDSTGLYPIYNDLNDCFVGQFTSGDSFKIKETFTGTNKYVYTPRFSVWDQANNDKAITATGDNTNGYSFTFAPTTAVTTTIENLNIKARFENYMTAHTLTLKKELTNATDTTTDFTFQILFDFDYGDESGFDQYIAYPLYYTVDGQSQYVDGNTKVPYQLSGDGKLTFKAGQVVEIEEIPENAKIKIVEILPNEITAYRYDSIALTKGGVELDSNAYTPVANGVEFSMGNDDMAAVVTNRKPNFGYTLKYTYTPYVTTYRNQSYTVKGVFTDNEKQTYLTLDANGHPVFQSDELKKTFVNNKAPYEDNFQQTLSFADSTIVDTGEGKGWNNDSYTCEVTAKASSDNMINAYFNLPYAVDDRLVPQESGTTGRVAKITAASQGKKDIACFDWYVTAGKSKNDKTGSDPVFVKAPLILYTDVNNADTAQYFQYWRVKTQPGYEKPSVEYTRCYDYEFNFALFMDCIIEPVYGSTWAQTGNNPNPPTTYNMYQRYDAELQITHDNTNAIQIAFLENSRNQYNNSDNGGRTASPYAADVVYSDFLLNFNYIAGLQQLNQLSENTKKAGIVVEAVNYMDYETDDQGRPITGVFDYDKNYSSVESFNSNADDKASEIKSWLTNGGTRPAGIAKSEFDVRELDNKNCIQFYYSLNNRAYSSDNGGQLLNTLQNRYKVFRAYAYIGNVSGNKLSEVQLSAPVYFTIYDAGSQGLPDNDTRS